MFWGRQVAGRNYPPTNKNTLIRALTLEWDKLPQQLLDNVVQTKGVVAKQFSECHRRTAVQQVAFNDVQRGPVVKRKDTLDHNSWFKASVACNSESRIGTLSLESPDTCSMIVRTQLEAGSIAKHYTSPVSMIPT
ncbi:hypothetical protein TNCV_3507011 [Trichonephila clavipes]|uniref:Uncharacterized protein n=1 Tax=Trichonephila clavipes TaxID=2585209 RepID=A0A8X6RZ47_TRICX|nr:hypothetical protein TNCV_3507011 [Trichonephila clavipes]